MREHRDIGRKGTDERDNVLCAFVNLGALSCFCYSCLLFS